MVLDKSACEKLKASVKVPLSKSSHCASVLLRIFTRSSSKPDPPVSEAVPEKMLFALFRSIALTDAGCRILTDGGIVSTNGGSVSSNPLLIPSTSTINLLMCNS